MAQIRNFGFESRIQKSQSICVQRHAEYLGLNKGRKQD